MNKEKKEEAKGATYTCTIQHTGTPDIYNTTAAVYNTTAAVLLLLPYYLAVLLLLYCT